MVKMFTKKFERMAGPYHRDIMFFIDHPFSEFYFGHEFDDHVYEMEAELYNKEYYKDNDTFTRLFYTHVQKMIDSGCRLVSLDYDPTILASLGRLGADYREYHDSFQFFTFFHNDEDTELLFSGNPQENLLELKETWRSCLAKFAFVNVIEISLGDVVDIKLADRLYREYPPVRCFPTCRLEG
jgi:hypothetical protein